MTREITCLRCAMVLDAHSYINPEKGAEPNDGDVSICAYCGHCTIFDSTSPDGIRNPTPAEIQEIEAHPDFPHVEMILAALRGLRRGAR